MTRQRKVFVVLLVIVSMFTAWTAVQRERGERAYRDAVAAGPRFEWKQVDYFRHPPAVFADFTPAQFEFYEPPPNPKAGMYRIWWNGLHLACKDSKGDECPGFTVDAAINFACTGPSFGGGWTIHSIAIDGASKTIGPVAGYCDKETSAIREPKR